ncbi:hypothetical protein LLS1_07600 [Leifsonia sp. LS1]|nr:hypothetical protein LLS1_07600 [Leifsonia sp. LS1]
MDQGHLIRGDPQFVPDDPDAARRAASTERRDVQRPARPEPTGQRQAVQGCSGGVTEALRGRHGRAVRAAGTLETPVTVGVRHAYAVVRPGKVAASESTVVHPGGAGGRGREGRGAEDRGQRFWSAHAHTLSPRR